MAIELVFLRYSDIPNIKSIYQRTSRKSPDNLKFEKKYKFKGHNSAKYHSTGTKFEPCIFCSNLKLSRLFFEVLWYIDLIFGVILYLDELHFKFEFRSGRMIFGWVMTLELVFFFKFEVIQTFLWQVNISKDIKKKSGQLKI
jgi:hypothetical protein